MKSTFVRAALALMAAAAVIPSANAGDVCLSKAASNNFDRLVGNHTSWGISTKKARKTWDDWIWRGPERYCNKAGGDCIYTWTQANTKAYSWAIGADVNFGNVPVIGGVLGMFNIKGEYEHTKSYTETFGWSQTIRPGQRAQPVQVVVRRWKSGDFQGGFWRVNENGGCWLDQNLWGGGGQLGNRYWWDGKARWGSWSANVEERRYGMYHIWR